MDDEENETSKNRSKLCFICNDNQSKYNCPRCNTLYCSLECYKSEKHQHCSESFYRDCVNEEMASYQADDESRQKMMEILTKLHKENGNDEFDDSSNPLVCINENDDETHSDIEDEIDSDDNDVVELKDRIVNINLDDPEALWNALTEDEKNEFESLVSSEDVGQLLPIWQPWWLYRKDTKLVEEVKEAKDEDPEKVALKMCPPVKDVVELTLLSKSKPADCVKFNIINVIAAYAFVMRYFNGDCPNSYEFISYLLEVCSTLSSNTNFEDEQAAVEAVVQESFKSTLVETDTGSLDVMKQDIYLILRGPSTENSLHYCQAALSDLHRLLNDARRNMKLKSVASKSTKPQMFAKRFPEHGREHLPNLEIEKIKACLKKVEYYMSYVKCNGMPAVI